jgi:hypothetical protein
MASPAFNLAFDIGPFEEYLSGELQRQVKFAMAVALTKTAKDVQLMLQGTLHNSFTIRSTWASKGIRIKPARKNNLTAEVGSRDVFMARQGVGGTKPGLGEAFTVKGVAFSGVPVAARPNKQKATRRAKWPKALLEKDTKKKAFFNKFRSGVPFIAKRRTKKRYPIQIFWILKHRVQVPKSWPFKATVWKIVDERWQKNAIDALEFAIKTSRPKPSASL